jgi:hypothetical protein
MNSKRILFLRFGFQTACCGKMQRKSVVRGHGSARPEHAQVPIWVPLPAVKEKRVVAVRFLFAIIRPWLSPEDKKK